MITLITGQPGAGKSLFGLWHIKQRADKEGRPVYQNGITGCTLPWHELEDAKAWNECPEGSIIVIDECQRIFPVRPNGSQVPAHVSPFETHRHKGYDIYLITQHPTLVDAHVRRLTGRHFHVIRQFGLNRAKVYERQHVADQINNAFLKDASCTTFSYPKEVFSYYKSAEIHTHKPNVPKKALVLIPLVAFVVGCIWFFFSSVSTDTKEPEKTKPQAMSPGQPTANAGAAPGLGMGGARAPRTKAEYLAAYTPRIPDFPHTAPVFDDVTNPDKAPQPQGCAIVRNRCRCFTQQATVISMSEETCRSLVDTGYFISWGEGRPSERKAAR